MQVKTRPKIKASILDLYDKNLHIISWLKPFAYWVILHVFLSSADFFFKINFFEKKNSGMPLECQTVFDPYPYWARSFVGPDLGPS